MEAGRLLLRSLSDLPRGRRISALTTLYRANLAFLMREAQLLPGGLRERFDDLQSTLEAAIREQTPERRSDVARQLALRAWRRLVPPR